MWLKRKEFDKLETRIKELEKELSEDTKEDYAQAYYWGFGFKEDVPTIKSSLDAIIKYLGIEIVIEDEKAAQVVVKVVKEKKK